MAAEEAALDELRQAIVAKSILIKMLKAERNAAQKKVAAGRGTLRTAVVDLDYEGKYVLQQKDSLFIDGLSSDFERLMSTTPDGDMDSVTESEDANARQLSACAGSQMS